MKKQKLKKKKKLSKEMERFFNELKKMTRYYQTNGKYGFMFSYEEYLKLRKKFLK